MQTPDEIKKYCANCGKEITGGGIDLNFRYSVCSEDCKKEFTKREHCVGKSLNRDERK